MYLRNLQQVENEGSYRGISCVQARRIARFVQHLLAFVRTPQRCAHPRDEVRAEQLTAYRQVSGCKGKQILGITQRLMLGIT